jgi:hypothetical protein
MTRPTETPTDANRSVATTAGGIFRGILNNVGSTVVGGMSSGASNQWEHKVAELSNEVGVLQEELESKIAENERLVIEGSDLRRDIRELTTKCSSLEKSLVSGNQERAEMEAKLVKAKSEIDKLRVLNETGEITIDSLRRDSELQNEQLAKYRSLYENVSSQLSELVSKNSLHESELRELRSSAAISESLLDQLRSELSVCERERNELQQYLSAEKAQNQSLSLRVQELEDEISVSMATSSVAHLPPPSPSNRVLSPSAGMEPCGPGDACCYRSEYYQTKCKNLQLAIKTIKSNYSVPSHKTY